MKLFPFLLLLTSAVTAYGSDTLTPAPQTIKPFEITKEKDLPVFCAGIAFAATGFVLEHSSEKPLTQLEIDGLSRNSVNWFDRSATYCYSKTIDGISSILVDLAIAAPLGLLADGKIRDNIKTFSLMYAEVEMFSYVLPSLGKILYKRPRPYNYNPEVPLEVKQSDDSRDLVFFAPYDLRILLRVFYIHDVRRLSSGITTEALYLGRQPGCGFGFGLYAIQGRGAFPYRYRGRRTGRHACRLRRSLVAQNKGPCQAPLAGSCRKGHRPVVCMVKDRRLILLFANSGSPDAVSPAKIKRLRKIFHRPAVFPGSPHRRSPRTEAVSVFGM